MTATHLPPAPDDRSPSSGSSGSSNEGDTLGVTRQAPAREQGLLTYVDYPGAGLAIVDPLSYAATVAGLAQTHGQAAFLAALRAGHQLVVYDQRGSGDSHAPAPARDWEQRASDLWAVADAAGVERAVLYGVFDAGATIAYAAAQQPERVLGLIFNRVPPQFAAAAGEVGVPAATLPAWFQMDSAAPLGHPLALMQAVAIPAADAETLVGVWQQTATPDLVDQYRALLMTADLRQLLPRLTMPALVLAPHRSPVLSAWGDALAALLPRARVVHPDSGGEALGAIHAFLTILAADVGRLASRLPAELSSTLTDTRRAVNTVRRIIVPIETNVPTSRAVELACRLGASQRAEIVLVHVVVVGHALSLEQPLDEATRRAERALTLGRAIVAEHGLPTRTVVLRERSAAGAIVRLAREVTADLIVMSLAESPVDAGDQIGRTAQEVLRRAPCEVIIDRGRLP